MVPVLKVLLAAAFVISLPVTASAAASRATATASAKATAKSKPAAKQRWRGYGFLPGYRQPPDLTDWRYRSTRYRTQSPHYEMRYWRYGQPEYGWGYPGTFRGRWNGGSFGPCYTSTPIGLMWNCGQ